MRRRAAASALGLALAAGVLGAGELSYRYDERFLVLLPDSGRRFATRPGVKGTNTWSFHERELPPAPDPAVRRIVVLGDSVTWGSGPAEEAWPRLAEEALGPPWQVLNLSHFGYDTAQEAAVLREHGWAYQPELVVYASFTNDPMPSRLIRVGDGYVFVGDDGLLPSPLRRASALLRRGEGALLARSVEDVPDWEFYRSALSDLREQAAVHHVPLVQLGLVPHVLADPDGCDARWGIPGECARHAAIAAEQERIAADFAIPYRSVLPALRASGRPSFYPEDPHDPLHAGKDGHVLFAREFLALVQPYVATPVSSTHAPNAANSAAAK